MTLPESEKVGNGWASRKTSSEIEEFCNALSRNPADLVYISMMSAKVDSSADQDGCPCPETERTMIPLLGH